MIKIKNCLKCINLNWVDLIFKLIWFDIWVDLISVKLSLVNLFIIERIYKGKIKIKRKKKITALAGQKLYPREVRAKKVYNKTSSKPKIKNSQNSKMSKFHFNSS